MQNVNGNSSKQEPNPWDLRHGASSPGKLVPFGARVEYCPSLPPQRKEGERFDATARPGVLVGYHINPGGRWSGDYYVLDLKVIQEKHDARYIKARRTGEIIIPPGDFTFPGKEIASVLQPKLAKRKPPTLLKRRR
jgi:hypothetical protein